MSLDKWLYAPQKATAKIMGVGVTSLQKWDVQPSYIEGRMSFYYLPEVVAYKQNKLDQSATKLDLQDERAKLANADCRKRDLEIKILERSVLPRDEIALYWAGMVEAMKARLLSLPSKAASIAINCTELHEIEKELQILVYEALNEIAKYGIPDITARIPDSANTEAGETSAKSDSKPVGGSKQKTQRRKQRGTRAMENK